MPLSLQILYNSHVYALIAMETVVHLKAHIQLRGSAVCCQSPCPRVTREERRQYFCRWETLRSRPCESPHCLPCILCHWQTSRRRLCHPCERGLSIPDFCTWWYFVIFMVLMFNYVIQTKVSEVSVYTGSSKLHPEATSHNIQGIRTVISEWI
jgi:hypothetical protein